MIYTGASIKYIESIFGPPVKEEHSEDGRVHEYIYSFKKFYLQVVYDNNNTVILYSVTSKDENFHPEVPYLRKPLDISSKILEVILIIYSRAILRSSINMKKGII
ncbi:hypothetical protein EH65_24390 [Escherichia coli]|nr:hypothetical protein EH65_24390 [Escherichia coli]